MIRRILSVILFGVGGFLVAMEGILAFAGDVAPGLPLLLALPGMTAMVILPPLVLLALGTWATPGVRARELGLVLMISAGATAFLAGCIIYVSALPEARAFMSTDTEGAALDGYWLGCANLLLMAGAGWLLYRQGQRSKA